MNTTTKSNEDGERAYAQCVHVVCDSVSVSECVCVCMPTQR